MLNHAYTLLLNRSPGTLVQDIRLVDPGFTPVRVPNTVVDLQRALYADCSTPAKCEQRAEALLPMLTTPEMLLYTLKFDPRNTYPRLPSTLLTLCTTDQTVSIPLDRLDAMVVAVRLCPSLFLLPAYSEDMQLFHRLYYSAPDRYLSTAGALLAYVYQLEAARVK